MCKKVLFQRSYHVDRASLAAIANNEDSIAKMIHCSVRFEWTGRRMARKGRLVNLQIKLDNK